MALRQQPADLSGPEGAAAWDGTLDCIAALRSCAGVLCSAIFDAQLILQLRCSPVACFMVLSGVSQTCACDAWSAMRLADQGVQP